MPSLTDPSASATLTALIPTTYVSDRRQATIVAALLCVRHLGASCQG
ncbi:MAG: hypothetical protein WAL22_06670 [Solirubrobacteraceae bacterium]